MNVVKRCYFLRCNFVVLDSSPTTLLKFLIGPVTQLRKQTIKINTVFSASLSV